MLNLVQVLTKARGVLAAVAGITPIKTDDAFVALLDAFLADATLLGWLETKVQQSDDGTLSLESTPPVAIQEALERHRLTFPQVLEAIPVIIQLWRMFRG